MLTVLSTLATPVARGKGNSIVVQLVSTNESAREREFARLQEQDLELDDFDLTPKQMLMSYIENSFPTVQFEKYVDDNGNVRSKPVYDSESNAVINREAVRQKEMLLDKLGSIKVPASALERKLMLPRFKKAISVS